jgi:hypothetical protein
VNKVIVHPALFLPASPARSSRWGLLRLLLFLLGTTCTLLFSASSASSRLARCGATGYGEAGPGD